MTSYWAVTGQWGAPTCGDAPLTNTGWRQIECAMSRVLRNGWARQWVLRGDVVLHASPVPENCVIASFWIGLRPFCVRPCLIALPVWRKALS